MGATFTLSRADHPARIDVFEGWPSVAHVGLGFLAGLAGPGFDAALLAAFAGYQVSQAATGEPWTRTGGEFIEFAGGMLLAKLVGVRL